MRKRLLVSIIAGIVVLAVLLSVIDKSPFAAIAFSAIVGFIIYFMWSPPPKHKDFSDADRLKAMSRALGGSGPPELWTPDMPHKKSRKRKHKT
jgi:uncharacterized membrane protein YfcA